MYALFTAFYKIPNNCVYMFNKKIKLNTLKNSMEKILFLVIDSGHCEKYFLNRFKYWDARDVYEFTKVLWYWKPWFPSGVNFHSASGEQDVFHYFIIQC